MIFHMLPSIASSRLLAPATLTVCSIAFTACSTLQAPAGAAVPFMTGLCSGCGQNGQLPVSRARAESSAMTVAIAPPSLSGEVLKTRDVRVEVNCRAERPHSRVHAHGTATGPYPGNFSVIATYYQYCPPSGCIWGIDGRFSIASGTSKLHARMRASGGGAMVPCFKFSGLVTYYWEQGGQARLHFSRHQQLFKMTFL